MAFDLKPSVERVKQKLHDIEELAFFAQADADANVKIGGKYMALSRAIGKIAVKVRDTLTVREYWYAKFVEDGVLIQPKNRGRDVPVASDKDVSSADDATRTSRPLEKEVR